MSPRSHTKLANTAKKARQFSHVRQSAEERGMAPGRAIAMASGVLKRQAKGRKTNRKAPTRQRTSR